MKFLILLILIPFLALAESGVSNSFKIAGNSTTSKNLVNGSFESGANTGWTVGAGTLTATTAERVQGLDSGLWSVTGAGTIDLCATPTNLASTDLIASGWVKSTSPDLQVCSVINSVENGCTALGTITGWKKVTASGTYASGNFCFRLKSVASGAITAYVDDVKVEPLELQQVSTVEQEGIELYGNGGTSVTTGVTDIPFTTVSSSSLSALGTWTGNTTYTALKKQQVSIKAKAIYTTGLVRRLIVFKNAATTNNNGGTVESTRIESNISTTISLNANDSITIREDANGGTLVNDVTHRLVLTATAVRDNVIQSYESKEEVISISQAQSAMTDVVGQVRYALATASVKINSTTQSSASSYSSKYLTIEDDSTGARTKVTAKQETVLSGSFSMAITNTNYVSVYKNGVNYKYGGQVSANDYTGDVSFEVHLLAGEYISFYTSGSNSGATVATATLKASSPSAPTLLALPTSKDNNKTYDKTLVTVTSNVPSFLVLTSNFYPYRTISKVTGSPVWRMAFNVVATGNRAAATTYSVTVGGVTFLKPEAITSHLPDMVYTNEGDSTIIFRSLNADTSVVLSGDVELASKPTWADEWNEPGVFISNINPDGFNKTSGQVGLVDTFSFSFGTTNATTVCSASPCSYLDQIGNNVTSVTRTGAGVYVANLGKTFTKLKCYPSAISASVLVGDPMACSSCNSIALVTRQSGGAVADSFGNVLCQGY